MTLDEFFRSVPRAAIAFSGGVDSAYLLYAAVTARCPVRAYYVRSEFQPAFELADAKRLAEELGADLKVIPLSVLGDENIRANGPQRCYHCKKALFSTILREAQRDGFTLLLDGTNASDTEDDRPGMQAVRELAVRSPLRECGLTKEEIRRLSREAGLFTWNKPAYACLATRQTQGEALTTEALKNTEAAEDALSELGFRDFRVRSLGGAALLQLRAEQLPAALDLRDEILARLRPYYTGVTLDMEART